MSFTTIPQLKTERNTLRLQLDAAMKLLERTVPYVHEARATELSAEIMAFLEAGPEVKAPADPEIGWVFRGDTGGYHVTVGGETVHFTKDATDRDMFIARLKLGRAA